MSCNKIKKKYTIKDRISIALGGYSTKNKVSIEEWLLIKDSMKTDKMFKELIKRNL